MTTTAAAPSLRWEELPAVMVPPCLNTGLSLARASAEVSRRGPSSLVKVVSRCTGRPSSSSDSTRTSNGTISGSNRPESTASAASRWERRAKASWSSRLMLQRSATRSPVRPMDM
jgi:hypothetical protein